MSSEYEMIQDHISAMIGLQDIPLPITNNEGDRWVIVALASEPLTALISRVRNVGGYANVFVPMGDRVVQFGMIDSHCALSEDEEPVKVYRDNKSSVGQFVETLSNSENALGLEIYDEDSPFKALKASEAKVLIPA